MKKPKKLAELAEQLRTAFADGDPSARWKDHERRNLHALLDGYRAAGLGDFTAYADSFTADVELDIAGPPDVPFIGRWVGRADVVKAVTANFAMIDDQSPEVLAVVAQGDLLAVQLRETGKWKATGRRYDLVAVQVFTFRGGKVAAVRQVLAYPTA